MIKVIAFDLVGVLVYEKRIELTYAEEKLERMFGPNINDSEFLIAGKEYIDDNYELVKTTEELINKLYEVREKDLFKQIKKKCPNVKIIIATNHVSYVRNFLGEIFDINYLDDIIISAEINKIKPNSNFYEHILNKYNIKPNELLFLDDNQDNVDGAKELGINTIKIDRDTNLFKTVSNYIEEEL